MRIPDAVREQFRRYGREGGRRRAARLSPERRSAIARRAAATRWTRARFGADDFASLGLPGGELVDTGLEDLANGRATRASLLVSLAAARLRREGVPVGSVLPEPDLRLYGLLEDDDEGLAHSRFNALLRTIVSFADACRFARLERD